MNTWQIVLICWLSYGIGFITGYLFKKSLDEDDELTSEFIETEEKRGIKQ